jgi:dienelactone hydrolase
VGLFSLFASAATASPPTPIVAREASTGPAYQYQGPYAVGVRTLHLSDRDVEVWYPAATGSEEGLPKATYDALAPLSQTIADLVHEAIPGLNSTIEMEAYRDLPVSDDRRFPVILFGHAFGGFRQVNSRFTAGAASWGFVVASPDYFERGLAAIAGLPAPHPPRSDREVLQSTIKLLKKQNTTIGGAFERRIDLSRIAVTGHSAGGAAALAFAKARRVRAVVGFAAPAYLPPVGKRPANADVNGAKPTMLIVGDEDIADSVEFTERLFNEFVGPPKRLVIIGGIGHNSFTDLCPRVRELGGLARLSLPFPPEFPRLADNGCRDDDFPAEQAWSIIQHFAVAHIRGAFGIDRPPVGLGPEIANAFPTAVQYTERP